MVSVIQRKMKCLLELKKYICRFSKQCAGTELSANSPDIYVQYQFDTAYIQYIPGGSPGLQLYTAKYFIPIHSYCYTV